MELTVLKSTLCPTCGGLLDIDVDKQMYICRFCGVSFDYEYFREDNVKDVASKAIDRSEFGSAKDAYDFMLTKDPHDFEALRGLFLCENKWKTMHPMLKESVVHITADDPALLNALENCLPEHKSYFEKVRESLNELKHYRDLLDEAREIDEKKTTAEKVYDQIKQEYTINASRFTSQIEEYRELEKGERDAIGIVVSVIPLTLSVVAIWSHAWWFFIVVAVIVLAAVIGYNVKKAITAKRIIARMGPAKKEVAELSDMHKAKSTEAVQSLQKYKQLAGEFMDMDPVPQKASEEKTVI